MFCGEYAKKLLRNVDALEPGGDDFKIIYQLMGPGLFNLSMDTTNSTSCFTIYWNNKL